MADDSHFEAIVVGTGPASSFFLHEYLRHATASTRVLVLERGPRADHRWHLENLREVGETAARSFVNRTPEKPWIFNLAFGGSSNWWWACTPRMLPDDFELQSRYGHGEDWAIRYDDLEEYYCEVEEFMSVSGPDDGSPFPRSRPYPQPPHRLPDPDLLFKKAYPGEFFAMPTARARRSLPNGRAMCCASGICTGCPIDAKFTVLNGFQSLYGDPRISLHTDAVVERVETTGNAATGVTYRLGEKTVTSRADLVVLGANAIFNPHLLLRSDLDGPQVGKGLSEQLSITVDVHLDGVDNFGGSTSVTGHGYMLHRPEFRSRWAASLMETSNIPKLRQARGKWLQIAKLKFMYEGLREQRNHVSLTPNDPERPTVTFAGQSDYTLRGVAALESQLPDLLAPLPVEEYKVAWNLNPTEAHILGTAVMGNDPESSVVDADLIHHRIRNLLVVGGSAFPTSAPANPTLTISALSLRSARRLRAARSL